MVVAAIAAIVAGALAGCDRAERGAGTMAGRAEATATLDAKEVAFGDELTLTIEARADPALEVELPAVTEIPGFRVIDTGTTSSESGGVASERRWVRLRADDPGTQTLPAFEVRYRPATGAPQANGAAGRDAKPVEASGPWQKVSTAPITLEVRSLLPPGDQPPEIHDIKPLQPIHRANPWLWLAGGIAAVVAIAAAVAWWLRRRRGRVEERPAAPPVPAHVIALAALDRLAANEPVGDAAVRRFYFELSEIVRAYIEGRFGLNATDLTTEEILSSIHGLSLSEAHARGLRGFLCDTDAVKFASQRPQRGEVAAILDWSRRFVEETRPIEIATPAETTAQEAA